VADEVVADQNLFPLQFLKLCDDHIFEELVKGKSVKPARGCALVDRPRRPTLRLTLPKGLGFVDDMHLHLAGHTAALHQADALLTGVNYFFSILCPLLCF